MYLISFVLNLNVVVKCAELRSAVEYACATRAYEIIFICTSCLLALYIFTNSRLLITYQPDKRRRYTSFQLGNWTFSFSLNVIQKITRQGFTQDSRQATFSSSLHSLTTNTNIVFVVSGYIFSFRTTLKLSKYEFRRHRKNGKQELH